MAYEGQGRGRGRRCGPLSPIIAADVNFDKRTYFSADGPVPVHVPEPERLETMATVSDLQFGSSGYTSDSPCDPAGGGDCEAITLVEEDVVDMEPEEFTLKFIRECPPNMAPDTYARKLKAKLIKEAKEKVASRNKTKARSVASTHQMETGAEASTRQSQMETETGELASTSEMESEVGHVDPSLYHQKFKRHSIVTYSSIESAEQLDQSKSSTTQRSARKPKGSSSKSSKDSSSKMDLCPLDKQKPLQFNKLKSVVSSLTVRRLSLNPANAWAGKHRLGLKNESVHFLRLLTSGSVELLELTLGTPQERQKAEPGKSFKPVPGHFRQLILEACTCMVTVLNNCYNEDRHFDPIIGGVDHFTDFLMDYLVINRVGCASGRYTFEFVAQIMERLYTNPFQERLLTGLINVIRPAISRLCWGLKPPKKKGVLRMAFIDTLFVYLHLLECLVFAIHTIDEASLLAVKSFERVTRDSLSNFILISVLTKRIGVQAEKVFKRMERRTPLPPAKRKNIMS